MIPSLFQRTAAEAAEDAMSAYPEDEAGWIDRYDTLWAAYVGKAYTPEEILVHKLFKAVDDDGKLLDVTQRVHRDFQFLVRTYAGAAIGAPGPVLEADEAGALAVGEAIWKRSRVGARIEGWAKTCGALGDFGWEIARRSRTEPYMLLPRDPRVARVYYDATCTRIERVVISVGYVEPGEMSGHDGVVNTSVPHQWRRELTDRAVTTWRDGVLVPEESGPHTLGVVPFVHVCWEPWTEPEHGLPAGHPIDKAMAMMDSIHCQIRAVGARHGNPVGVAKGFKLGGANDVGMLGRVINGVPVGGSFEYAEPSADVVGKLLDAIDKLQSHVRQTDPAYIFGDAGGGQESGQAKGYRAAAFENAVSGIRGRFFGGLTEAIELCACATARRPYDPDHQPYRVDLPPILPRNVQAEVSTLDLVKDRIKREDYTRHLQRLGFIDPELDPVAYASEVEDEVAARAQAMFVDPAEGGPPDGAPPPKGPPGSAA